MSSLPTDDEIRARAEATGRLLPGAELTHDLRRSVAAELHRDAQKPRAQEPAIALLSRFTYPVPGGTMRVDVTFIPADPTKENTHGR